MPVTVTIPTALRQYAGGQSEIEVEARTAGEALDSLTAAHADLRRHLFNEQNRLRNFVNVYVNDEDIRHAEGADTPLKDGDTVMSVPSIAGGAMTEDEVARGQSDASASLPSLSHGEIARQTRQPIIPEVAMRRRR